MDDDNDLEPEVQPTWRKALWETPKGAPPKVNFDEAYPLAAALAAAPKTPALAASSTTPLGASPAEAEAPSASPSTPPGALTKGTLFDQEIILRENEQLKRQVAELNEKVNILIRGLDKVDFNALEVVAKAKRTELDRQKVAEEQEAAASGSKEAPAPPKLPAPAEAGLTKVSKASEPPPPKSPSPEQKRI